MPLKMPGYKLLSFDLICKNEISPQNRSEMGIYKPNQTNSAEYVQCMFDVEVRQRTIYASLEL